MRNKKKNKAEEDNPSQKIWAVGDGNYALYSTDYGVIKSVMKLRGMPRYGADDIIAYTDSVHGRAVAWQIFFPGKLEPEVRELICNSNDNK